MRQILLAAICWFAMPQAFAADTFTYKGKTYEAQSPHEFIQAVVDDLLNRLDGRRDMLADDTEALHALVGDVLDPVFDFRYSARLVLGLHARKATPEQLARFEKAFYNFLVITYAEGIVKFTSDRIKVLPFRGKIDPRRTLAKTEVYRNDGTPVPVAYALRYSSSGWKVYDVVIEGISYVTNYRNDLNTQISQEGLEAVIKRFEDNVADKQASAAEHAENESEAQTGADSG